MSSKTGDLDLGLETSKMLVLIFFKFSHLEFIFILELFMSLSKCNTIMILTIGNLDLDLQGQIGLQTFNIFILTVKH